MKRTRPSRRGKPTLRLVLTGGNPGPRGELTQPALAPVTTRAAARNVADAELKRRKRLHASEAQRRSASALDAELCALQTYVSLLQGLTDALVLRLRTHNKRPTP